MFHAPTRRTRLSIMGQHEALRDLISKYRPNLSFRRCIAFQPRNIASLYIDRIVMKAYIALIFPVLFINRAVSLSCLHGIEVYVGSKALNKVVALNDCSVTNASVCLSAFVDVPQPNHVVSFAVKKCFGKLDIMYLDCEYLLGMLRKEARFETILKNSSGNSTCNFSYCEEDGCNSNNVSSVINTDSARTTSSLPFGETNGVITTQASPATTSAGVREIIAYAEMLILVIAGYMYSNSFISAL